MRTNTNTNTNHQPLINDIKTALANGDAHCAEGAVLFTGRSGGGKSSAIDWLLDCIFKVLEVMGLLGIDIDTCPPGVVWAPIGGEPGSKTVLPKVYYTKDGLPLVDSAGYGHNNATEAFLTTASLQVAIKTTKSFRAIALTIPANDLIDARLDALDKTIAAISGMFKRALRFYLPSIKLVVSQNFNLRKPISMEIVEIRLRAFYEEQQKKTAADPSVENVNLRDLLAFLISDEGRKNVFVFNHNDVQAKAALNENIKQSPLIPASEIRLVGAAEMKHKFESSLDQFFADATTLLNTLIETPEEIKKLEKEVVDTQKELDDFEKNYGEKKTKPTADGTQTAANAEPTVEEKINSIKEDKKSADDKVADYTKKIEAAEEEQKKLFDEITNMKTDKTLTTFYTAKWDEGEHYGYKKTRIEEKSCWDITPLLGKIVLSIPTPPTWFGLGVTLFGGPCKQVFHDAPLDSHTYHIPNYNADQPFTLVKDEYTAGCPFGGKVGVLTNKINLKTGESGDSKYETSANCDSKLKLEYQRPANENNKLLIAEKERLYAANDKKIDRLCTERSAAVANQESLQTQENDIALAKVQGEAAVKEAIEKGEFKKAEANKATLATAKARIQELKNVQEKTRVEFSSQQNDLDVVRKFGEVIELNSPSFRGFSDQYGRVVQLLNISGVNAKVEKCEPIKVEEKSEKNAEPEFSDCVSDEPGACKSNDKSAGKNPHSSFSFFANAAKLDCVAGPGPLGIDEVHCEPAAEDIDTIFGTKLVHSEVPRANMPSSSSWGAGLFDSLRSYCRWMTGSNSEAAGAVTGNSNALSGNSSVLKL